MKNDSGFMVRLAWTIMALGLVVVMAVGCGGKFGLYPDQGNPCATDAAGIPPPNENDLICKVLGDPREAHLLIKLAEATYFAENPKHADEALKYLGEVRKVVEGPATWDVVSGLVNKRFGGVVFAALGDELPQFNVPQLVSPRDKFFLLYAIGKYEGIARAGLAMRAQKK